ncbi:hypothetical protein HJG60_008919 [Phyllostomus discolor]|uniref:Uncharacterized protein n=1 Tax=Phyllostomus discolor TaxID=89673 RepID=A0A833YWJ3_9CHIR|nr:hypothetical protein HJG60_008919 [Phyllostomus discolor]
MAVRRLQNPSRNEGPRNASFHGWGGRHIDLTLPSAPTGGPFAGQVRGQSQGALDQADPNPKETPPRCLHRPSPSCDHSSEVAASLGSPLRDSETDGVALRCHANAAAPRLRQQTKGFPRAWVPDPRRQTASVQDPSASPAAAGDRRLHTGHLHACSAPPCRCKAIGLRSLLFCLEPPLPPGSPSEALGCKQRLLPKQPRHYGEGECEEIYFFKRNMTHTFRPWEPGRARGGAREWDPPWSPGWTASSVGGGLPQGPARGARNVFCTVFLPPSPGRRLVSSLLLQRGEGLAPRPSKASSLWEPLGPRPGAGSLPAANSGPKPLSEDSSGQHHH